MTVTGRWVPPGAQPRLFPAAEPPRTVMLEVAGQPVPQGSKGWAPIWRRARGVRGHRDRTVLAVSDDGTRELVGINLVESSKSGLRVWRAQVAAAAAAHRKAAFAGPVTAAMVFTFARPASHYRGGKFAGLLTAAAPVFHSHRPDLSKLARAAEDALTDGGLLADDALICCYLLAKGYPGQQPPPWWPFDWFTLQTPGVIIYLERNI